MRVDQCLKQWVPFVLEIEVNEGQIGGCKQMNFQLGSNKLLEEHNGVIRMVLGGSHNEWN